jgi:2,4-dichlorophenol 6-monooxygenase
LLEPILVRDAVGHDVDMRFSTELITFEEITGGILATLRDRITGNEYTVTSKYLIGADGANSKVATQLGLPMDVKPQGPQALNILFDADLSLRMGTRTAGLHWVPIHPH